MTDEERAKLFQSIQKLIEIRKKAFDESGGLINNQLLLQKHSRISIGEAAWKYLKDSVQKATKDVPADGVGPYLKSRWVFYSTFLQHLH